MNCEFVSVIIQEAEASVSKAGKREVKSLFHGGVSSVVLQVRREIRHLNR